jgi:hypothetical protein
MPVPCPCVLDLGYFDHWLSLAGDPGELLPKNSDRVSAVQQTLGNVGFEMAEWPRWS